MRIGLRREAEAVKALGDEIGYGQMIALASALWRKKLRETGTPESGAFIPTLDYDVKPECLNKRELIMFDNIIKEAIG